MSNESSQLTADEHHVQPDPGAERVIVETSSDGTEIHHHHHETTRSFGSFLMGVLVTLVAGAIALVAFLVVSDADDDGSIDLDVPSVDVDAP